MKVTHLQSSTQIIHLGEIKVLTDPWLTEGEYFGSWYHYPPFGESNLNKLEYDFIYVSHIHPDHLSEKTFKLLPYKKPVLIHNYDSKFVKRKLENFGYEVIECDNGKPYQFDNRGSITIFAADNCNPELCGRFFGCDIVEKKFGSTQIDTLALFKIGNYSILNTNDCPYELASETIKINKLNEIGLDLLLVGYAGAGPYPQCYEFDNESDKLIAANEKEKLFLNKAINFIELTKPKAFAPFAGTYILGSSLSKLNKYRGVPSVSCAVSFLNDKLGNRANGILLEKFDVYDLNSKILIKNKDKFAFTLKEYINDIAKRSLEYENDNWEDSELKELINAAYRRFKSKANEINLKSKTKIIIKSKVLSFQFSINNEPQEIPFEAYPDEPFIKIELNHNLLHRLLRGPRFGHWNNAMIGSHLQYFRKPDIFERGLYHCMSFFHY